MKKTALQGVKETDND